jgi:hypothetical protein
MKSSVVDEEFAEAVLLCEDSDNGWRALTTKGEVLNVRGGKMPEVLTEKAAPGIDDYEAHVSLSVTCFHANKFNFALQEIEKAIAIADTKNAQQNRSLILLSLGRWREGFKEYDRAHSRKIEPIDGKRVVIVHECGFGDTIMLSRFVPNLYRVASEVVLDVPPELERLLGQLAPIGRDGDVKLQVFSLMNVASATPSTVPRLPYLKADKDLVSEWDAMILKTRQRRIGIAWSEGHVVPEHFQRSVPLDMLVEALGQNQLVSLQIQERHEANRLGVFCPFYKDFADVAAVIELCDEVVCIDTAAINLAGALGKPATVLLSHSHSWRWKHGDLYPTVRQLVQDVEGDWVSCLAKL